jgi:N-acetylglucosaminyldiphosphoundecaprenol N-acetyl-beta-D-mannosaminyltransferase
MIISGMQNGYYKIEDEEMIISGISSASPDYLFIALPSPRKEHFILKYKKLLNVGVFYGVGGALDAKAGILKRPPKWFREYGLEWCLRLLRKPSVYGRRVPLTIKFLKLAMS